MRLQTLFGPGADVGSHERERHGTVNDLPGPVVTGPQGRAQRPVSIDQLLNRPGEQLDIDLRAQLDGVADVVKATLGRETLKEPQAALAGRGDFVLRRLVRAQSPCRYGIAA